MALQKASVAPPGDGVIEEVPNEIPRGRGGRPKIRVLLEDGTESRSTFTTYTRASTLGKALESDYAIQEWQKRMIVHGMSRRHDLVLRAASIATTTESEDKSALTEVAEAALEAAKATAGATKGTALHKLSERVDAGEDLSYLPPDAVEALNAYRRLMALVRVVASETFVVCDALETAGTFDRVVELLFDTEVRYVDTEGVEHVDVLVAGTRLVLDLKTNKSAQYFGPTYSCQQAVYGNGMPYTHLGGRGSWPQGRGPSRAWALILHVPLETPQDSGFYWVDLQLGLELGHLACTMRAQTGRGDLFWPTNLEPVKIETKPHSDLKVMAELKGAQDEAALNGLWEIYQDIWTEDMTRMVRARLRELNRESA